SLPRLILKRGAMSITNPVSAQSSYSNRGEPLYKFTQERSKIYRFGAPFYIDIYTENKTDAEELVEEISIALLYHSELIATNFSVFIEDSAQESPPQIETGGGPNNKFVFKTLVFAMSLFYELKTQYLPKYPILNDVSVVEEMTKEFNELKNKNIDNIDTE